MLEGLQLLSGLSLVGVRNAVSVGDLHPDKDQNVCVEEARNWLARRREFCPSRWRNLADDQWPFDPDEAVTPDEKGMIWVPRARGEAFVPDLVVRTARRAPGISITIGAKGEEVQHRDFYEALTALAKMDVARWRRRNSAGNWGIVRARGAWVAVSKAEVDRQIAEKLYRGDVTMRPAITMHAAERMQQRTIPARRSSCCSTSVPAPVAAARTASFSTALHGGGSPRLSAAPICVTWRDT